VVALPEQDVDSTGESDETASLWCDSASYAPSIVSTAPSSIPSTSSSASKLSNLGRTLRSFSSFLFSAPFSSVGKPEAPNHPSGSERFSTQGGLNLIHLPPASPEYRLKQTIRPDLGRFTCPDSYAAGAEKDDPTSLPPTLLTLW
ncbi:hypothetical protein JCM8547_000685, partial [Rhodosporidiobolus lusitaniae]